MRPRHFGNDSGNGGNYKVGLGKLQRSEDVTGVFVDFGSIPILKSY